MILKSFIAVLIIAICINQNTFAQHSSHDHTSVYFNNKSAHHTNLNGIHKSAYTDNVERDPRQQIKKNPKTTYDFIKESNYPQEKNGSVTDYMAPLNIGSYDRPLNRQWQTHEEGKQKDKTDENKLIKK